MTTPERPNVLDLRQVVAEREHRHRHRPAGMHRPSRVHPPRAVVYNWAAVRGELKKYALGVALAGLVTASIIIGFDTLHRIHQASNVAKNGVAMLEAGLAALNNNEGKKASSSFTIAISNLNEAETELRLAVGGADRLVTTLPIIGGQYHATATLLSAAKTLAQAGRTASEIPPIAGQGGGLTIETNGVIRGSLGWFATLASDQTRMQTVVSALLSAYQQASTLKSGDIPKSIRPAFTAWQKIGDGLFGTPDRLTSLVKLLVGIGGQSTEQNYLVMFQNNDELRPTGGFMGTYLLVKFRRGTFAITDAPGTGPYALVGQIPQAIRPPAPLDEITSSLTMIDANWYPDARTSAKVIEEIYRRARGFRPDGVIYVTPEIVERILALTGPITIQETGTTVTAKDFVQTIEQQVEIKYDKAVNAPKQVLISLLPTLLQKVTTMPAAIGLQALAALMDEADRGNIIVTSEQALVAQAASQLNWDGAITPGSGDYFAEIDANVNSGKTDRSISVATTLAITPSSGDWVHEVTIKRRHLAERTATPDSSDISHAIDNTEYIRLIVPAGANLTNIDGIAAPPSSLLIKPDPTAVPLNIAGTDEGQMLVDPNTKTTITHAPDRTIIGFWTTIHPGDTQTIHVTYTAPHALMVRSGLWQLDWRRQPGSVNRAWSVIVKAKGSGFAPTAPTTGWKSSKDGWVWTGDGAHSAQLLSTVKEK